MSKKGLLSLGNPRKVKENLSDILEADALNAIEIEIENNVQSLYTLALSQFRFAKKQPPIHWRQKVSRLYYAAYNGSKAVRLYVCGEYSTDVKDHKKIGNFPKDFPRRSTYSNQLSVLREDRNLADYDHASSARDLTNSTSESFDTVTDFLRDVYEYLSKKGLTLRGKP